VTQLMEMSLQVLAYNLKRVMKLPGIARTTKAVKMVGSSGPEGPSMNRDRKLGSGMSAAWRSRRNIRKPCSQTLQSGYAQICGNTYRGIHPSLKRFAGKHPLLCGLRM
jgi:hypothetical protein